MNRFFPLIFILALSDCSPAAAPCAWSPAASVVYVVGRGWHAEIGIPVEELTGKLEFFRVIFPAATTIMFGYGKRTFVTAPPETISEYIIGPFPGPAVIHVVGLRVNAVEAYSPEDTITLALTQQQQENLLAFIWNDLTKDSNDRPQIVALSTNPQSIFYGANSEYNLLHTCNTWTAEALHASGLPLSANQVSFSGQTMARADEVARNQCQKNN